MIFGGPSRKVLEEQKSSKADYQKAVNLKGDSKQEAGFRLRIGLRARACVDKIFIDGAEKFAAYSEMCLVAIAKDQPKPKPPEASPYPRIKTVNGEISGYLPEDLAKDIFELGGKYQNVEIDAKTAIRRAQVICNQVSYDLNLDNKIMALQFLRDELEAEGDPFTEADEVEEDND
ncbi:MAG: hypothetical protein CBC01_07810 [Betaproteobacteria bacterium TMED41]|nr:MAG: hypothetical protein CBC01_07810 [Betaproteobacteria bacterium TMED41]|tara:strand:- start:691 stop:1215 length:525 start_codon:yes stop_codon:yes gene_type:complete